MPVCTNCRHLYGKNKQHECPSQQYMNARNRLIDNTLQAEELFTLDELEFAASGYAEPVTQPLAVTTHNFVQEKKV